MNIGIAKMNWYPRRSILAPRFERIFHIVRSPYKHISSFATHTNQSYEFATACTRAWKSTPVDFSAGQIDGDVAFISNGESCQRGARCNLPISALHWLSWNSFLSTIADNTYRLEDQRTLLLSDAIMYMKGHRNDEHYMNKLKRMIWPPRRVLKPSKYHEGHARYGREDIEMDVGIRVSHGIDAIAAKFGYFLNDDDYMYNKEDSGKHQFHHGDKEAMKEL